MPKRRNSDPVPPDHVQTKTEIAARLANAGIRPRKQHGQHFLIDGNLMRRLAEAAEIHPDDTVLEVGCGTGGLTDLLLRRARHVIGVEVDRGLYAILADRCAQALASGRLTLLHVDALGGKHQLDASLAQTLHKLGSAPDPGRTGRTLLAANLPYGIATPLVMNLLVDYPHIRRLVFTVQAEVGERFTAGPRRKSFAPISILAQALCDIRLIARVPPQAFWPIPDVGSVMLRLDVRPDRPAVLPDTDAVRRFAALLRRTFEHRRKTLRSALTHATGEADRDRACKTIDCTRRPESLTVEEWLALFERVEAPR